ncbi:hypothetical protein [Helicobacter rodentium]|uniref:hypothetical protein n=1 Tax=Helicobacter rodentium TaxID=59617 RepID=UPI002353F641|nr:hypothetical protein [Helicobacter rodentium]
MGGFIGLNELFRKLELAFGITLSLNDKLQIRKLLYPLSNQNVLRLTHKDFENALVNMQIENEDTQMTEKIKHFIVKYLVQNKENLI